MAKAAKKAEAILREMVGITLNTSLTRIQRTNLETCITVHMHQKEISGARWIRAAPDRLPCTAFTPPC